MATDQAPKTYTGEEILKLLTTIPETVVPETCRLRVVEWMVEALSDEIIETDRWGL